MKYLLILFIPLCGYLYYREYTMRKEAVKRIDFMIYHFESTHNMDSLYRLRDSIYKSNNIKP